MNNEQNQIGEINLKSANNITYVAYILCFIGFVSAGLFSVIGVLIASVKREGLEKTIYYSHLSYLIKNFWIFLPLEIIGAILINVRGIGILVLAINHGWYIYRLLSGFTKLLGNKPI